MISACFHINKADALALALHYYSASQTVRKARLWTQWGVPLLLSCVAVLLLCRGAAGPEAVIPVLGWAVLWAVGYPKYHAWQLMRVADKMFSESSYQKMFGACRLTLNEDGIMSSSPVGEAKYPWSAVTRVQLTAEHLLIFLSGPQGYSIPKKQLPDTTVQEIKAFAEARMATAESSAAPQSDPTSPHSNSRAGGPPSVN